MKTVKILIIFLAVLTVGLSTDIAKAEHFDGSCGVELNAVEAEIEAAVFDSGKPPNDARNEQNLLDNLDAAGRKIDQEKFGDAIQKLEDISAKATAWAGAAKPKLVDATGITEAVDLAISCVNGL